MIPEIFNLCILQNIPQKMKKEKLLASNESFQIFE